MKSTPDINFYLNITSQQSEDQPLLTHTVYHSLYDWESTCIPSSLTLIHVTYTV